MEASTKESKGESFLNQWKTAFVMQFQLFVDEKCTYSDAKVYGLAAQVKYCE